MFDTTSIIKYRFVQRNSNKTNVESFLNEYIYCFLLKTQYRCSKYIVKVKEYKTGLLTVEFYRKVKSDKRYKLLSNDFKFGRVGVTILDIMREVQTKTGHNTYGLVAATLLEEASDDSNKRFNVYVEILRRKVDSGKYKVFGTRENSFIFVVPISRIEEKENIFLDYGKIFEETN